MEYLRIIGLCVLAVLWADSASYLAGFVGGVVLIGLTIRRRKRTPMDA
ncbi:MAG: hypothetical protein JXO22_03700 [Phycisphaerae bacterium]|nr:hypothetical protein [Phycisphaerae bacterium]